MGRPKKLRMAFYKPYYDRAMIRQGLCNIPPSTLRSRELQNHCSGEPTELCEELPHTSSSSAVMMSPISQPESYRDCEAWSNSREEISAAAGSTCNGVNIQIELGESDSWRSVSSSNQHNISQDSCIERDNSAADRIRNCVNIQTGHDESDTLRSESSSNLHNSSRDSCTQPDNLAADRIRNGVNIETGHDELETLRSESSSNQHLNSPRDSCNQPGNSTSGAAGVCRTVCIEPDESDSSSISNASSNQGNILLNPCNQPTEEEAAYHFQPSDNPHVYENDQSEDEDSGIDEALVRGPCSISSTGFSEEEDNAESDDGSDEPADNINENLDVQMPGDQGEKSFGRLKKEIHGKYGKVITEPVVASYGEILLNALEYSKHHNLNHLEKTNLMKLINSLFGDKVLPDTRYLLDALLFSQEYMHFYFFCKKCSWELKNEAIDKNVKWAQCPNDRCKEQNHVGVLEESCFFVLFDIPYQLRLLLSDSSIRSKVVSPSDYRCESANYQDIYDGECYRNFAAYVHSDPSSERYHYMSFSLCTDGSGLYSNSPCSIWPCFLMVNELQIVTRMGNLIVAGLWFGAKKAKMDLFLRPIVECINYLSNPGFSLTFSKEEIWHVKAYLIACCVDSGARGEVQGTHSHRGAYGCNWCLIPGIEWEGARRYPFSYPFHAERTLHQMLRDARLALTSKTVTNGVKGPSQLAGAACFHIVDSMILDGMHSIAEGNGKTFLKSWAKYEMYIGKDEKIAKIEKRIQCVKPPVEVRKYLRTFKCHPYWTGREWENWVLYFSVPILVDILPEKYLKNWILFVQAVHLLSRSTISHAMLNEAHLLIINFVAEVEALYGLWLMRYNVHIMLHLAENTKRWGPVFAVNSFAFEHGIQIFKKMVSANKGIPSQICRQISLEHATSILRESFPSRNCEVFAKSLESNRLSKVREVGNVKLIGMSVPYNNLTDEERWHCDDLEIHYSNCSRFSKIKKKGFLYSSAAKKANAKSDNSVAKLTDGKIVQIQYFLCDETSKLLWVVASVVRVEPFMCPPSVIKLGLDACFLLKVTCIDEDLSFIPVDLLNGVYVNFDLSYGHFLSPIAYTFNMF